MPGCISLSGGDYSSVYWVEKQNPTFVPYRQGECEIQIVVKDCLGMASEQDTVVVSTGYYTGCPGSRQSCRISPVFRPFHGVFENTDKTLIFLANAADFDVTLWWIAFKISTRQIIKHTLHQTDYPIALL